MKRTFVALLSAFTILSLSSCGPKEGGEDDGKDTSNHYKVNGSKTAIVAAGYATDISNDGLWVFDFQPSETEDHLAFSEEYLWIELRPEDFGKEIDLASSDIPWYAEYVKYRAGATGPNDPTEIRIEYSDDSRPHKGTLKVVRAGEGRFTVELSLENNATTLSLYYTGDMKLFGRDIPVPNGDYYSIDGSSTEILSSGYVEFTERGEEMLMFILSPREDENIHGFFNDEGFVREYVYFEIKKSDLDRDITITDEVYPHFFYIKYPDAAGDRNEEPELFVSPTAGTIKVSTNGVDNFEVQATSLDSSHSLSVDFSGKIEKFELPSLLSNTYTIDGVTRDILSSRYMTMTKEGDVDYYYFFFSPRANENFTQTFIPESIYLMLGEDEFGTSVSVTDPAEYSWDFGYKKYAPGADEWDNPETEYNFGNVFSSELPSGGNLKVTKRNTDEFEIECLLRKPPMLDINLYYLGAIQELQPFLLVNRYINRAAP